MQQAVALSEVLERAHEAARVEGDVRRDELGAIVAAIAGASMQIADFVALGRIVPREDETRAIEIETDNAPAARARRIITHWLRGEGVREIVCAGRAAAEGLDPAGTYSVAIDPLDGASNLDTNMALGTIFSVTYAGDASRPRAGKAQLAAGFVVYGPQTNLVLTMGDGVDVFTLDRRDGTYRLAVEGIKVPTTTREYAIDSSNYRHWPSAVRSLIDDHREEAAEPGAETFNMRWIGSLVAEAYRILVRGGVFLCPPDKRPGEHRGCQRLVSAAHPIAFIMEQAGARATTGHERIMDRATTRLDQRTPFIFGSRDAVERIERLHTLPESFSETSPLFQKRGLFRI